MMIDDCLTVEERILECRKGQYFKEAVIYGHIEKAKRIVESFHNIDIFIYELNYNGYEVYDSYQTPIQIARDYGNEDLIEFIRNLGGDENNVGFHF